MTGAIAKAISLWPSEADFRKDLQGWINMGCNFRVSDDYFVVAKDVDGEAWFVYIAVGNLRELLSLLPYPLPYIGWGRELGGKAPKYYSLEKVLAKAGLSPADIWK